VRGRRTSLAMRQTNQSHQSDPAPRIHQVAPPSNQLLIILSRCSIRKPVKIRIKAVPLYAAKNSKAICGTFGPRFSGNVQKFPGTSHIYQKRSWRSTNFTRALIRCCTNWWTAGAGCCTAVSTEDMEEKLEFCRKLAKQFSQSQSQPTLTWSPRPPSPLTPLKPALEASRRKSTRKRAPSFPILYYSRMLDGIKQWLAQNELWLTGALAVVGIIEWFFKPLRWAIPKLWSLLSRPFKTKEKQPTVTLHFVAMDFPESQWVIGGWRDKPITSIVTRWHVTQAPGSGVQVLLLKAHLLKPFAKYLIHSRVTITSGHYQYTRMESTIPERETRNLIIECNLSKVLEPEVRLKVHLAVEDQFARKHKLPPIMVKSIPTGK
jgi:hypothetical protein